MSTLLLCLSGPMQSWGVQSKFDVRDTGLEPSKSGVIGLLCAALGLPRDANMDPFNVLRMGVRLDRPGLLARDYHTAGKSGFYRASGTVERKQLITSTRYYLADACFLVGLEGDPDLLRQCHHALRDPVWPLFLGRKAFVPGVPIWLPDGFRQDQELEDALQAYPLLIQATTEDRIRLVLDDPSGEAVRPDVPLSFADRRFTIRHVRTTFIPLPERTLEVL